MEGKMKMKKKHTNKNVESVILIDLNEDLKKLIHKNMATVYSINIDRKKKKNIKVQINIEIIN